MKKLIALAAVSFVILSIVSFAPVQVEAQTVVCPVGLVCTPIVQVPGCPEGYTCVPTTTGGSTENSLFSVTYPSSGAILNTGSTYKITWSGRDQGIASYSVYLVGGSLGSVESKYLGIVNTEAQDWFSWTVPSDIAAGSGYQIQFSGHGATGDNSEPFSIIKAQSGTPCYVFNKNLQLGDRNADVVALQTFLVAKGYTIDDLTVSRGSSKGYFGLSTFNAVRKYQARNGIPDTGFIGAITRAKLNADCSVSTGPSITVLSPNGGEHYGGSDMMTVKWNSKGGDDVAIYLSYPNGSQCYVTTVDSSNTDYTFTPHGYICPQIPQTISDGQYKVSLYLHQDNVDSDIGIARDSSDMYFTIASLVPTGPSITVDNPSVGEVLKTGSLVNVNWESYNIDRTWKVHVDLVNLTNYGNNQTQVASGLLVKEGKSSTLVNIPSNISAGSYQFLVTACPAKDCTRTNKGIVGRSSIFSIISSSQIKPTITASLVSATEDRAGVWNVFGPGKSNLGFPSNDWKWEATLSLPESKVVKSIEITSSNGWEGWSTKSGKNNPLKKDYYPLVYFINGDQQNDSYDYTYAAGPYTHKITLYGQPESTNFPGGTLVVEFTDGTSISTKIPSSKIKPITSKVVKQSITITSPKKGIEVVAGTNMSVTWTSNNITSSSPLYIWLNGEQNYSKQLGYTLNDSKETIAIPSGLSGTYELMIQPEEGGSLENSGVVSINIKSNITTVPAVDTTAPTITSFTLPATSESLTIPVTLTGTDNVRVSGYYLSESSSIPSVTATGWTRLVPTVYTFSTGGLRTLYAFVRDAAGNISASKNANVDVRVSIPAPILNPSVLDKTIQLGQSISQVFVIENISTGTNNSWDSWTVAKGSLPDGVTLNVNGAFSGSLSGTPTAPGVYNFMIRAHNTTTDVSAYAWVYLTVTPAPTSNSSLQSVSWMESISSGARYYNPRVNFGNGDLVPYHDNATAAKWCQAVPNKSYTDGTSYLNSVNPTEGARYSWDGSKWIEHPRGNYPRYYICSGGEVGSSRINSQQVSAAIWDAVKEYYEQNP